jgi:hypothetical protein
MRTTRSPHGGCRPTAPRALIAPAVLASALVATAAVGVIAGGRPVAALSTASQATIDGKAIDGRAMDGRAIGARTVAKTSGWRVVTTVGPAGQDVSGTLTAHSASGAWSVWIGTHYTAVERLAGAEWTRVPIPAELTSYVRSAVAFDGDSASDFWLFNSYRANHALRFTGSKWTLQQIPAWVLPQRSGGGGLSAVTTSVFGPGNVWVFGLDAGAYAAHYNGRTWAKVRLPAAPDEVSAVSPDDIWALLGDTAWHGNGKTWTAIKIPKAAGNPPETFGDLTVTGSNSAWVWRTILAPRHQTEADVLHWNGTSWRSVGGTPADIIDSVAPDGSGGLWATGVDVNPGGFNLFYHLTGGRWTEVNPPAGMWAQAPENLTWIPGTRSLWGTATGLTRKGADAELIKYGP